MTAVWRTPGRQQDGSEKTSCSATETQEIVGRFAHWFTGQGGEKSSNSGYLLKLEPTEFAEGLHVGCERKLKTDVWVWGLSRHVISMLFPEKWGQNWCGTGIKRRVWTCELQDTH